MDSTALKQLILRYTEGWVTENREQVLSTLNPVCLIIESYGPTYRGKEMVGRWFDSWFAPGNRVNRWQVTSFYTEDEGCFFEWIFECTYAGNRSSFEGASVARVNQGKIVFLREYAMTAPVTSGKDNLFSLQFFRLIRNRNIACRASTGGRGFRSGTCRSAEKTTG